MAEFNTGMSKVRQLDRFLSTALDLFKCVAQNFKDSAEFRNFTSHLQQDNPKHPVLNESNAAFYDVSHMGADKMQELLKQLKIPSAPLIDNTSGATILAVPKQFAPQANLMFAKHDALSVTPAMYVRNDQAAINKLLANATQTPAPTAVASLATGRAVTKTFDTARYVPLVQQMKDAGIPMVISHNRAANSTTIIFDQKFAFQVQAMDRAIEKAKEPAMLSYADFMKKNLGKEVVQYTGLNEAQARMIRTELNGSSIGYALDKKQDGTYTFRYNVEHAEYVEPLVAASIIKSSGPHAQAMTEHSEYITHQAEAVQDLALHKKNAAICDAGKEPPAMYELNNDGLVGPDGNIMVRRSDPKFDIKVYSIVNEMKHPMHKPVEKDRGFAGDAFTRQEIILAKEAAAKANPSEAQVIAAQLAATKISNNLAQPQASVVQVINDTAQVCRTMADSIEEENHRLSPEELAQQIELHGDRTPEVVVEFQDTVHKLTKDEKSALSDALRKTSDSLAGGFAAQQVRRDVLALNDPERDEEEYDRNGDGIDDRTQQHEFDNVDEPVVGEGVG